MKKIICMIALGLIFAVTPANAAPPSGPHGGMHRPPMHGGVSMGHRPPMYHGGMHRPPHYAGVRHLPPPPPLYRPYRPMPVYRPYYTTYYPTTYYSTTYTTYPTTSYETVVPVSTNTVVVRDNYAGINTAANVINAAANVAATIKYLTW